MISIRAYCRAPRIHCGELADFLGYVDRNRPLIIAGDVNENQIGMAMRSLKDQGFARALSASDTRSKTWCWKALLGLVLNDRYDHILFDDHLDCTDADVVAATGSDHLPVRAVMVRKESLVALEETARP